jgi:hypothetical protein
MGLELIGEMSKQKIFLSVAGVMIGALAGYAYWFYIGCNSGTCLITSSPANSTIYGTVMGFFIAGVANDWLTNRKIKNN